MSVQLTRIGVPPRTPQDWDVPAAQIEDEAACLILREAARHTKSPSDRLAYALDIALIANPEACAHAADAYPGWTAGGTT
jgi:hypothetical protein